MIEKKSAPAYAYWGVACKSDSCKNIQNTLIIKFWGVLVHGQPHPPAILPKEITVTCPTCNKSHEYFYDAAEIIQVDLPARRENFVDLC
jgi:hypothetical protein